MEYIQSQKEKRTFKDIVLDQLNKILQLSCDEFRGGYTQKQIKGNWVEEIYVPDARKRISQAIEFFSFLLQPIYDKDMVDKSKEIKKKVEDNLKKFNEKNKDKSIDRDTFRVNKLSYMKELFEELNYLLSRKSYLKGQTVTDSKDFDPSDYEGDDDSK